MLNPSFVRPTSRRADEGAHETWPPWERESDYCPAPEMTALPSDVTDIEDEGCPSAGRVLQLGTASPVPIPVGRRSLLMEV